MDEIKKCPFCGKTPIITKNIRVNSDRDYTPPHDIEVGWDIKCTNCGTRKSSYGFTYYRITDSGELEIVPQNFSDEESKNPSDKRKEVIEMWNKRFN